MLKGSSPECLPNLWLSRHGGAGGSDASQPFWNKKMISYPTGVHEICVTSVLSAVFLLRSMHSLPALLHRSSGIQEQLSIGARHIHTRRQARMMGSRVGPNHPSCQDDWGGAGWDIFGFGTNSKQFGTIYYKFETF